MPCMYIPCVTANSEKHTASLKFTITPGADTEIKGGFTNKAVGPSFTPTLHTMKNDN